MHNCTYKMLFTNPVTYNITFSCVMYQAMLQV